MTAPLNDHFYGYEEIPEMTKMDLESRFVALARSLSKQLVRCPNYTALSDLLHRLLHKITQ